MIKKWVFNIVSTVAALALIVATSSAGATCFFTAYQPDLPEELR